MPLDLVLKDIYRKRRYSLGFIKTQGLIVGFFFFFLFLSQSFGFIAFGSNLNLFTVSVVSFFRQYSQLTIWMLFIACLVVTFSISWTLVSNKIRDIGIMKAVGALPGRLYSFYITELLILTFIGFGVGWIVAVVGFSITRLVLVGVGLNILNSIDPVWTLFLLMGVLLTTFITGTVLLRKIGQKTVIETFSVDIPQTGRNPNKFTPIPRILMRLGLTLRLATRNLVRRVKDFYRHFAFLGILLTIIFSVGLALVVVGQSNRQYFRDVQGGDHLVVVGHEDVVPMYQNMYDSFRGESPLNYKDFDFENPAYYFNTSHLNDSLSTIGGIVQVEDRILYYANVQEKRSIQTTVLTEEGAGNETLYTIVGQNRTSDSCIVGFDPNNTISKMRYSGSLPSGSDDRLNVIVGDSLASTILDVPLQQSIYIRDITSEYDVAGVVIDSLNRGNVIYVGIEELREELDISPGDANLVLIQLSESPSTEKLAEINASVHIILGSQFTIADLTPTFKANMQALLVVEYLFTIFIVLLVVIGNLSIVEYQKASLETKVRDFAIMKAIGAKRGRILRLLFTEGFLIVIASSLLAIAISMIFVEFFLIEDVVLPSLAIPFMIYGVVILFLGILNALFLLPLRKRLEIPANLIRDTF